jgi:hypothetical protein
MKTEIFSHLSLQWGKSSLLFLFFVLLSIHVMAQDVIITEDGDARKVFNVEVSGQSVFFTLIDKPDAAIQKMDKSKVLMIKHKDGTREVFSGESAEKSQVVSAPSPSVSTASAPTESAEELADAKATNDKILQMYYGTGAVTPIGKTKGKEANFAYIQFHPTSKSVFADNNLVCDVTMEMPRDIDGYFVYSASLQLQNTSDRTIYVDLGNTFFIRSSESSPYYIPSATSTTTGTSGGVGFNLGAAASALGVGGAAGTLASGMSVGGGSSKSSSTVTYSQRIIAIPPRSRAKLEPMALFPCSDQSTYGGRIITFRFDKHSYRAILALGKGNNVKDGNMMTFNENNSQITWGSFITYSFDENATTAKHLNFSFYGDRYIGLRATGGVVNLGKHLSPNWDKCLGCVVAE